MLNEVQQMIGIYNRGSRRTKGTFIQHVKRPTETEPKVYAELSGLQNHKIAIAHVCDEDWKQLKNQYSRRSFVRVRVSDGRNFSDKPPRTDENGVYIFHLVLHTGDLSAEEWKEILSGLSDPYIVKQLVDGKDPNELRRFFVPEVAKEHLSALNILCEGYLAVHADSENDHTDIKQALEEMKWPEFRKSERYRALIREDLGERICKVQQSEWWSNVFGQESFYDNMKKEWKDTTGTEEIPTALNNLLATIRNGNTIKPPKIVADAYCALVKKK